MESCQPLIIIAGPTAVGKSDISVKLAEKINGEIISADSMQVYREMDIGTAKLKTAEMHEIKHYMIDELSPDEEFNVMIFANKAKQYIKEIAEKKKTPILVGGTGFYIQAVLYDTEFTEYDESMSIYIRNELQKQFAAVGNEAMYDKLRLIDPVTASIIHANDTKRVLRALEYHKVTGKLFSQHNQEQKQKSSPYDFSYFFLNDKRDKIYDRIDKRVDLMISKGLVDEVKRLLDQGYQRSLVSMQGLGYKEIVSFLYGEISLEDAIYKIKRDTRHFAKRQITWQRKEKDINVIDRQTFKSDEEIIEEIIKQIDKKP